jgi:hypothetical protein
MKDIRCLILVLSLALAHGLVYVFIVPPWQHYDEPNHFEYVWLAANLDRLPKLGDYNPKLSRQVLKSMLANGFYDQMTSKPVVGPPENKVSIPGYGQLSEPPLYYLTASLPLRLMHSRSIDAQLVAARLVSLGFYLLTVLSAWGIALELTSPVHPLRWMLPVTVVILPGFTDLMTAVNNDVAAVAVFSLFLWGSIRLMLRGFSLSGFLWVIGAVVLAFFAKNTALVSWLLLPIALLFSLLRGKNRWLSWVLLLACSSLVLVLGMSWGDAAYWYRANSQAQSTRFKSDKAILGDYVLQLDPQAEITPQWLSPLFQPLPTRTEWELRGKTVTLGVWMWADHPIEIPTPSINTPSLSVSQLVNVGQEPVFFAFPASLPPDAVRTWVAMPQLSSIEKEMIYYDGLVLAEGERPIDQPPRFSDPQGRSGVWGDQPFTNLLRNPSAEQAGLRVRPLLDNLSAKVLPVNTRLSLVLTSFLDWPAAGNFYLASVRHLFQTFWARFGWGHVPLIGERYSYWLLAGFSLVALFGCVVGVIRREKGVPWDLIVFMGIGFLAAWGTTLARGATTLGLAQQYVPVARHAYPLIIPVALFLCLGWLEVFFILNSFGRRPPSDEAETQKASSINLPNIIRIYQLVIYFSLLGLLDIASLASITRFFGLS